MTTIAGIPSTTKFSNIGGQIMVYLGGGSSRPANASELKAYQSNPTAFDVYGPGNRLIQTGTQTSTLTAAPATTAARPAQVTTPAITALARPVAPVPTTGMQALQTITQPAALTPQQQLAQLSAQLGKGTPEQQSQTLQAYQRTQAQINEAARQAAARPAVTTPVPQPQPAPVVQARPAAIPIAQPVTPTAPAPAPITTAPQTFQLTSAPAPTTPATTTAPTTITQTTTPPANWYTSPANPFNTNVPVNYAPTAAATTPVTVNVPKLNLAPFWFQNMTTPFQWTTPITGSAPSTGMNAFSMPAFNWGMTQGPR